VSTPDVAARWEDARNVLCVRLDAMGDVLMTGPAIRALAYARPGRRLTLLTSPGGAQAARLLPELDDVIPYEAPWMKASPVRTSSAGDRRMADRLRHGRFDGAIVFTCYTQSPLPAAWLCLLADIPLRLAHCRENPYQLLTDWIAESEPDTRVRHEVRRQLDLVSCIGCSIPDDRMSIVVGTAAADRVERLLDERIDRAKRWVAMHPGATAESRRYPPELFAAAARRLVQALDCQVVWTGVEAEQVLIEEIRLAMREPSVSLAGLLDLEELAAFLAKAPLLISNNTGAVHLASAVGTPVVDLYALTNPQHTPWRVPCRVLYHDVPCRFCYKSVCPEGHHLCLRGLTPDTVVAAAFDLLEETRRTSRRLPALQPRPSQVGV